MLTGQRVVPAGFVFYIREAKDFLEALPSRFLLASHTAVLEPIVSEDE